MARKHDSKITEYAIYDSEGELIDVLELNAKQHREYVAEHPEYNIVVIPDADPDCFESSEFDDLLEENGYYN